MSTVSAERLVRLQQAQDGIRNICILAHVDHGKTSLTDSLIAANGIISPKLAGRIRYLDSRADEQLRGITMESSAISLHFSLMRHPSASARVERQEYLINLIDSPGHIDFSSEVSTASRLCDGAVVLVDAVEGVCSQTVTVLRQTWTEKLKPLLVINKMDRLVTELKMSPGEAYIHLTKLLEQVNAVMGSFFQGERMEGDLRRREHMDECINAKQDECADGIAGRDAAGEVPADYEERDDQDIYFAPDKNNVIFSSAIDGWAFTVKQFAVMYERKLGFKRSVLERILWGDYYLDPRTKKVLNSRHLKGRLLKPIFVQLVLEQVWAVYEATTSGNKGKGDPALVEKITKGLSITLPPHLSRSRDPRTILTAIFSGWLPLSTAVLVSVIEYLPSPPAAQATRMQELIDQSPASQHVDPKVRDAIVNFKKGDGAPVVAYVSKMISVPESDLPERKQRGGDGISAEKTRVVARKRQALQSGVNEDMTVANTSLEDVQDADKGSQQQPMADPEHLIGFARVYSGTLSVGDSIYVLPPRFTPAAPHASPEPLAVTVTALYLLMGRGLEPLAKVPAGCVVGIGGLAGNVPKSGTVCSQLEGAVNLAGIAGLGSRPIVRVALEPERPADLGRMVGGLKLLVQSDPCVQYEVLESGEHVVLTAGELHLERCLKDLRERFACCDIQAGVPIVPYRESAVAAPEMSPPVNKHLPRGTVIAVSSNRAISVRLRVRPLPAPVTTFLAKHTGAIKRLYAERRAAEEQQRGVTGVDDWGEVQGAALGTDVDATVESNVLPTREFREQLFEAFAEAKGENEAWTGVGEKIVAFGPRRTGPNLLVDETGLRMLPHVLSTDPKQQSTLAPVSTANALTAHDFADKIAYAFQLATYQGPLCNEPVQGISVHVETVTIDDEFTSDTAGGGRSALGQLTGETIKAVRGGVHAGLQDWSPRLLLAMYQCEIQCSADVLGRVYAVVTRRRGRIVNEALNEGTSFFTVAARLPVAESFGFAAEMRTRTSGAAQAQLVFVGFEMLDEDPFWVPSTEEEMEDLGELADRENLAKRYMEGVRRRKGLFVREKIVRDAEKQRTLKST